MRDTAHRNQRHRAALDMPQASAYRCRSWSCHRLRCRLGSWLRTIVSATTHYRDHTSKLTILVSLTSNDALSLFDARMQRRTFGIRFVDAASLGLQFFQISIKLLQFFASLV